MSIIGMSALRRGFVMFWPKAPRLGDRGDLLGPLAHGRGELGGPPGLTTWADAISLAADTLLALAGSR